MKFTSKRLLVLFSVALNIGFVIVAVVLIFHDGHPSHRGVQRQLTTMVERLDLPEAQKKAALESLKTFNIKIHELDADLKQAHIDLLRMLSQNKPLDQNELHRLVMQIGQRHNNKDKAFQGHIIALHTLLGNEKSAQFFSYLLENLEKGDAPPPR